MSDNVTAVLIVVCAVLGPIWIVLHFVGKSRAARQLNNADAAALDHMLVMMQRMEQRVTTLERILDSEVPDWRSHPANNLSQAS